jgi:hypothetical protein
MSIIEWSPLSLSFRSIEAHYLDISDWTLAVVSDLPWDNVDNNQDNRPGSGLRELDSGSQNLGRTQSSTTGTVETSLETSPNKL